MVMESIFNTIKMLLGYPEGYDPKDPFDLNIKTEINTAFNVLYQLGVGPKEGFVITGDTETWNDYIPNLMKMEMVKSFVYLKTKKIFDPSANSALNNSIDESIKELEFRLKIQAEEDI